VLFRSSEEASANINMVAAATEEMTNTISGISAEAEKAGEVTQSAVQQSRTAREKMASLGKAAQEISKVTTVISEISSQTNLLALNATIEAARAGDAGKGFAVVAGEVKNLASQTARATEDIASQVEEIRGLTDNVVNALHGVADVIGEVDQSAAAIAAAVEEQQASTAGISDSIQDANGGMRTVAEAVGALDNETARVHNGSANVTRATSTLNDEATKLRNAIDGFLEQIEKNKAEA
jgi:methyl-accepting chemotaxis protein